MFEIHVCLSGLRFGGGLLAFALPTAHRPGFARLVEV